VATSYRHHWSSSARRRAGSGTRLGHDGHPRPGRRPMNTIVSGTPSRGGSGVGSRFTPGLSSPRRVPIHPVLSQRRNQRRHPKQDHYRIVGSQPGDERDESDAGQDESAHARHIPHLFDRSVPVTRPRSTIGDVTQEPNESDQEHSKHRELCPGDRDGNHQPMSASARRTRTGPCTSNFLYPAGDDFHHRRLCASRSPEPQGFVTPFGVALNQPLRPRPRRKPQRRSSSGRSKSSSTPTRRRPLAAPEPRQQRPGGVLSALPVARRPELRLRRQRVGCWSSGECMPTSMVWLRRLGTRRQPAHPLG
jgi:hypothetical protein